MREKHALKASVLRVPLNEIVGLRHRMLRAGLPEETAIFPGDHEESTWHFGIKNPEQPKETAHIVCCASFMRNSFEQEPAWQLRGMATDAKFQGRGFGGILLEAAIETISFDSPIHLFWCNARVPAIPFYEKQGWVTVGDTFDIPTAGPHHMMKRNV